MMALLVISFITITHWLVGYIQDKEESEKNKTEIETIMREAELVKLRQQLQPHFLFNSLNSINALVITQPQEARKMVQQLSEFLRGTLRKDEQKLIPLKDELAHLNLYLEIEKVRFGHRLNIETRI
ncbi:MAG: histidine kinase [Sphingobacteriaceae bacterium]|nr:histidine kinase [Sphingobacteriaceae bacterium]